MTRPMYDADPIPRGRFLDPRPAELAACSPLSDAVNIPLETLPVRVHELPRADETIRVAGPGEFAQRAVEWLLARGRRAIAEHAPPCPARGTRRRARLWEPTAFLAQALPRLEGRLALDLGCGTGRDAVYLAAHGWRVVAIDRLPDAIDRARALAETYAVSDAISWRVADLVLAGAAVLAADGGCAADAFDLIIGFRFLHRPLFACLPRALRPGGSLLWETFTAMHRARHGRPRDSASVLQAGELEQLARGLAIRHSSEAWRGDAHTARLWAQRPSATDE